MGALVRVPIPFISCDGSRAEVYVEGATVREVLKNLDSIHEQILIKICDESGNLRPFVNIYLNDKDIRFIDHLETQLDDGDKIVIVPIASGG